MCPRPQRHKRPSYPRSTPEQRCEIPYQYRSSNSRSTGELALTECSVASRCRCQDKYSFQYVRYRYAAAGKAVLVASTRKHEPPDLCLPRVGEAVANNKAATSDENSRLGKLQEGAHKHTYKRVKGPLRRCDRQKISPPSLTT